MPQLVPKDGIDNVVVAFDHEDATYKVGSPLTGNVLVVCNETTAIRGVRIKLAGKMKIHWKKTEAGETSEFAEVEDYLDEDVLVWAPRPHKRDEMWIFPGEHNYPFSFTLPAELPDTMEDSKYGKVSYCAQATVYLGQQRISESLEEPFSIITMPDLSIPQPVEEEMPKENCAYAVIGGTCFTKKTYIELYLRLERSIYKVGESIPVHVEMRTEGGMNDIKKVTALLVQETIYTANKGSKDEARKKELLVVAEAVNEERSEEGQTRSCDLELLLDERLPLSNYPWCEFIEMTYYIHVVARTHSFYDDVVVKLPVIVGAQDEDLIALAEKERDEDEQDEKAAAEEENGTADQDPEPVGQGNDEEEGEKNQENGDENQEKGDENQEDVAQLLLDMEE